MKSESARRNIGNALHNGGVRKDSPNRTPFAQELRPTINQWNFVKLKSFFTAEEIINQMKGEPTEWERIFS